MSSSKSKAPVHSPPLIFPPLQGHRNTLIILHGRGSTAQKFAEPLLQHLISLTSTSTSPTNLPVAPLQSFRDHFPNTKFVFPTVLMGLSQGCAASIVATLLWKDKPFGGLVGMCGYLPFRKAMQNFAEGADSGHTDFPVGPEEGADDIFERDGEELEGETNIAKAVERLCDELQIDEGEIDIAEPHPMQSTPVFMGHGTEDGKVPISIGRLAAEFLSNIDVDITWKEYKGLGHWYSEDMLRGVVVFLKNLKRW